MLVLSRRPSQKILFPKNGITVEICCVAKKVVRVGIIAPPSVSVVREEIASESDKLLCANPKPADHRERNRLHTALLERFRRNSKTI